MKEIKILQSGVKQVGVRFPVGIYEDLKELSKKHKTSIGEIVRYIIQEEYKNYK